MFPFSLKLKSVLIVDGRSLRAAALSERFRNLGAKVHVVTSPSAAAMMIRNMKIDVVFVGYQLGDTEHKLRKALAERCVPYITCATENDMDEFAADFLHPDIVIKNSCQIPGSSFYLATPD